MDHIPYHMPTNPASNQPSSNDTSTYCCNNRQPVLPTAPVPAWAYPSFGKGTQEGIFLKMEPACRYLNMGVSENRGTPKWMIWGYPYFRKHPYRSNESNHFLHWVSNPVDFFKHVLRTFCGILSAFFFGPRCSSIFCSEYLICCFGLA